ncbi:NAD-dependent epimerase/dehydratase family protein [Aquiflexum gelatinilyticum]|uniref:NAD-dependent epimerase/dehydratase family protein n=1 Tax=Aquiflexum gelatinilyticum TaxID=2961943 RepID=A0A9X2T1A4_9BACT|nr:NAD-dependent epimerase/dehydratase family protein [Aquiflexum gelatinilyticum]MCR9015696.1 NAD-dependent epimerase/dehydratase family protein [Aquiflexum gelatinilyticum]MCS4436929.1 NAD-dependent epimerase/dehydratase family protein [Aquiflexum gelatinilyticum]
MKSFLTGASGYLGQRLAMKLAENGETVHALIRNPDAVKTLAHPNIKVFFGDVLDKEAIAKGMEGCDTVFHVAALARVWSKDSDDFYRVNVDGTVNVIGAAKELGISKFILTSSTGTIGPSLKLPNNEETPRWSSFNNDYEISKSLAEKELLKSVANGFPGLIVMPSRIFGPGIASPSSGVNRIIIGFMKKGFAVIPKQSEVIGNYGFIEDIVMGHILARDKGVIGEKYILGGENKTLGELFEAIKNGVNKNGWILKIPLWPLSYFSQFSKFLAERFGLEPKITPDLVKRLTQNSAFDCSKAVSQLGYQITPFEEAIEITIRFLTQSEKP